MGPNHGRAGVSPDDRKLLVIVKGKHRHAFRFTPGSEGVLIATLLQAVRDPANTLEWSDLLPVLVRMRDYILSGSGAPTVIRHRPS